MAALTLHLMFVLSWLPCDGMRPSEKISCLNFKLGTSLPRSPPFPERMVSTNSPRVLTPGGVILRSSSQDPAPTICSLNFLQTPQSQVRKGSVFLFVSWRYGLYILTHFSSTMVYVVNSMILLLQNLPLRS